MAKPVFETRANETVFAQKVSADTWKTPNQTLNNQISGKFYFTDQRITRSEERRVGKECL